LERFDYTFHKLRKPPFDAVPRERRRRLFGVDYVHLKGRQLGDLFVTAQGWAVIESLLPEHWFVGQKFSKVGRALAGATGAVFRVPVPHPGREDFAVVVKFSRFCQEVGITAVDPELNFSEERIDRIKSSWFLSPFEEFGNLARLRQSAGLEVPTKAPLAIYVPPARYLDWQLGRKGFLKAIHNRRLRESQADIPAEDRLDFDWERQYILLYRWINGLDAEQAVEAGLISESLMRELAKESRVFLEQRGWEVMDHKPRHLILRVGRNGRLLQRDGRPLWALVDYELLYPFHCGEA
jgi:hypothetical protein